MVRSVFLIAMDAFRPSGTGLNSRVRACFFSASKSCPPSARIFFAASSVIQPSMLARDMFLSGVTRSNFSRRLPCTTENGIAGGPGFVDDEDRRRALARSLLELVGPAAVVGHRVALERLRVELGRVGGIGNGRIVDEDEDRLALDVDVLEVVPVELGRLDAVAGEHHVGVLDRCPVGDVLRPRHDLVRPFERLSCWRPSRSSAVWLPCR